MAGTMTITYDNGVDGEGAVRRLRKITCDWTSDASDGTASGATRKIMGRLIKVQTDPGGTAPTDNWDTTIVDEESVDVVANCQNAALLIARDTANTEETYLYLKNADNTPIGIAAFPVVCNALTIGVANAGNSKTGQIIIFYEAM